MAAVTNQSQFGILDRLGAFLGMRDQGYLGGADSPTGMTVPTAYNTSDSWQPPGATGTGGDLGQGTGLGANIGTGQLALSGLGALAGIFGAQQQNKLAKEQFAFQKDVTNTNLNNQIKSYNTTLEDRMNARGAMEGRDAAYTASEIDRRRLAR